MSCDSCEIKNLIYQYADYIDRGELRKVAAMFRDAKMIGVTSDGRENVSEGEHAIYENYRAYTRIYADNGTPHTKHVTTNVMVHVDNDGQSAKAQAYAIVFQMLEQFPLQPIIGVSYYDRFRKCGGKWQFAERKIESQLFGDLSQHLLQPM